MNVASNVNSTGIYIYIYLLSYDAKITSHFYWISKSFRNDPKLPKYWAIQSLRVNTYNCPMLDQLLRYLKCAFLYMYDGAIFVGSHWSKLDAIWLRSNAPIFDITTFSFMNLSKPYIYSDAAWYNNCEMTPNMIIYNEAIFVLTLLPGLQCINVKRRNTERIVITNVVSRNFATCLQNFAQSPL